MKEDGTYPNRNWGFYTDIFYDKEYAQRCEKAIRQFNKGHKLIIEEALVNWRESV